jgi:hypothetical protein
VVHRLEIDSRGANGTVFTCTVDGCGRRVAVQRHQPKFVVIDQGDFFARHTWGDGPISVDVTV